jgi:hypothetical protein
VENVQKSQLYQYTIVTNFYIFYWYTEPLSYKMANDVTHRTDQERKAAINAETAT